MYVYTMPLYIVAFKLGENNLSNLLHVIHVTSMTVIHVSSMTVHLIFLQETKGDTIGKSKSNQL